MPGRLRTASRPSSTVMEDAPYELAPLVDLLVLRGVLLGAATGGVRLLGWCRSGCCGCCGCAPPVGVVARGFRLLSRGARRSLYSLLVPSTRTAARTPLERTQSAFRRPNWVASPENASGAGLRGHRPLLPAPFPGPHRASPGCTGGSHWPPPPVPTLVHTGATGAPRWWCTGTHAGAYRCLPNNAAYPVTLPHAAHGVRQSLKVCGST